MLDYDFERLAEEHIQDWSTHYLGMTRQQVITELSINYDWSIELENEQVPDADIEEFEYEFTKEVLKQLGLNISDHCEHLLRECIEASTGDVHKKLKQLYSELVY